MDKWVINKDNKSNMEKQPVASISIWLEVSTVFQLNKSKRPLSAKKKQKKIYLKIKIWETLPTISICFYRKL